MNKLDEMVKLLESNDYDCVIDPADNDAVFCFAADRWFYSVEEIESWLYE